MQTYHKICITWIELLFFLFFNVDLPLWEVIFLITIYDLYFLISTMIIYYRYYIWTNESWQVFFLVNMGTEPVALAYQNFYHINILKRYSNLGLIMSHRLNYEAAALTTQPPQLVDRASLQICQIFKAILNSKCCVFCA